MTVLLAYDRSPEGDAALSAALQEAGRRGTDAVVINVAKPTSDAGSPFSEEQSLDAVGALFANAGIEVDVRQVPPSPDEAEAILEVVDEVRPDVVVIGLRRRSRVGKFILGSTTQRILQEVDCPILAVKPASG